MFFKNFKGPKKETIFSRAAKEKRNTKLIIIGFSITAIIIIAMIGYAFIYDRFIKFNQPVAQIGEEEISGEEFDSRVRLERNAYILQYNSLAAQAFLNEESVEARDYFKGQMLQILAVLDDYDYFGEYVLERMINEKIAVIEAKNIGLQISEDDIDKLIQQLFNFFPDGTATPVPTSPISPTSTLSETQQSIFGGTPTDTDVSESTEEEINESLNTIIATPSITPTEKITETTQNESTATPTLSRPTATLYTQELYDVQYQDYLGDLEVIGVSEKYFRKYIETYLYNQKLYEEIVKQVERDKDHVWARHILVSDQETAIAVLNRLEGGDSWELIAEELSLDTSNKSRGGDLGWFTKGKMIEPFEKAAFELEIGQISNPIETPYGWHIIQVLGRELRPLNDSDYQSAQSGFYNNWFAEIKAKTSVEIFPVWKDHIPTEPSISQAMRAQ